MACSIPPKISIRIDLEFKYQDKKTARICFERINKALKISMNKCNGFHIGSNTTQLNNIDTLFLSSEEIKELKLRTIKPTPNQNNND